MPGTARPAIRIRDDWNGMTAWIASAGGMLALQAAALGDTLVMKTVPVAPTLFERISSIASGLVSITLVILAIALVPAAWNFRKSYKRVNALLDRVYGDITPLMRHASTIADNIDYITTSIRTDVQRINRTIATANQRVDEAVARTERRLREFDALLSVIQEEAEGAFVSTASVVRGARAGAAAFTAPRLDEEYEEEYGEDAEPLDAVPVDGGHFAAEDDEPDDEDGETTHGHDADATNAGRRPGPRIRSPRGLG